MQSIFQWLYSLVDPDAFQRRNKERESSSGTINLPAMSRPFVPSDPPSVYSASVARNPPHAGIAAHWDDLPNDDIFSIRAQELRCAQIQRLLSKKRLPPELISHILFLAQEGLELAVERRYDATYTNNANTRYLCTPKLESAYVRNFVLQVTIDTVSHDQGWSSDPNQDWIGTYQGSHTWWDLTLDRPVERSRLFSRDHAHVDAVQSSFADSTGSSDSEVDDVDSPSSWAYTEIHRKELCRNVHASSAFRHHTVTLDYDDPIVRDARPGDIISLWARSQYPGWVHIVSCARILVRVRWSV